MKHYNGHLNVSRFTVLSFDDLDVVIGLTKEMEAALRGLEQMRRYPHSPAFQELLEALIEQGAAGLDVVKRKIVQ